MGFTETLFESLHAVPRPLTYQARKTLSAGLGRAHARLALTAIAIIVAGPVYWVLARGDFIAVSPALGTSLLTLMLLAYKWSYGSSHAGRWARGLTLIALSTALASNFFATQRVTTIRQTPLRDHSLLKVDMALLGWLLPDGQLALWVDTNDWLGPTSLIGNALSDVLFVCYVSYYIWPYILMFLHLGQIVLCVRRRDARGEADAWMRAELFVSAWVFGFMATFFVNSLCPAVSPRIFLRERYSTRLGGLARFFSSVTNHDDTFGSFPSGHVGETLITGCSALLLPPALFPWYGVFVTTISGLITLATLWLRYHYAIDALATIPLCVLALTWGLHLPRARLEECRVEAEAIADSKRESEENGTPHEIDV